MLRKSHNRSLSITQDKEQRNYDGEPHVTNTKAKKPAPLLHRREHNTRKFFNILGKNDLSSGFFLTRTCFVQKILNYLIIVTVLHLTGVLNGKTFKMHLLTFKRTFQGKEICRNCEKGSVVKGKNLHHFGSNYFLFDKIPFQKRIGAQKNKPES